MSKANVSELVRELILLEPDALQARISDVYLQRPLEIDFATEADYEAELEKWYGEVERLTNALELVEDFETEVNSVGTI